MASSFVVAQQAKESDHILAETRAVAALVIVILIAASIVLYFFPDYTDVHFAWTIKPRLTAMLIGSGYLAGAYFFFRVLTGREWHRVAQGFLPITVFTIFMLLATLLHFDRFHHGQLEFYVWTIVYIITPLLVPFLWWRQRSKADFKFDATERSFSRFIRLGLICSGVAGVIFSFAFFYDPQWFIAKFPWTLTPLTARIAAGWGALASCTLLSIATKPWWSATEVLVQSGLIGMLLYLLAIIRGWADFDFANPLAWIFIASVAGLAILFAECERRMSFRAKRSPQISF